MTARPPVVQHVACNDAEHFLDSLSPRSEYFGDYGPRTWFFRGLADSQYDLLPSALRLINRRQVVGEHLDRDIECGKRPETHWLQVQSELWLIRGFFDFADSASLPLPEDSQQLRDELEQLWNSYVRGFHPSVSDWPPRNLLSLLALGQHHGIPTRLLDWSRHPSKAAYFAASGAVGKAASHDKTLSVWSLSVTAITSATAIQEAMNCGVVPPPHQDLPDSPVERSFPIEIITAPRAGNPNLHAQEGVFTLYRPREASPNEQVDRRPLDLALTQDQTVEQTHRDDPIFYHFTVPMSEASKVLWLLAKENITGATMFPGYNGAAEAVKEKRVWFGFPDRPIRPQKQDESSVYEGPQESR